MVATWVAIAGAAVGAAQQVIGNRRQQSSAVAELQDYGRHVAAVEYGAQRKQDALVGQAAAAQEYAQQQTRLIEANEMQASASADVAAAASATAGNSVDISQAEIEGNAAKALNANEKLLENKLRGIDQTSRDINYDADSAMYDYTPPDSKGALASVFLSGLQGAFLTQGFGE